MQLSSQNKDFRFQPIGRKTRIVAILLALIAIANYLFHLAGFTVWDWNGGQDRIASCVSPDRDIATCQAMLEYAAAQFEMILGMAGLLVLAVGMIGIILFRDIFWLFRFGTSRIALSGSSLAILVLFPWVIGHSVWLQFKSGFTAFAGMRGVVSDGNGVMFLLTALLAAVLFLSTSFLGDPKGMNSIMKAIKNRRRAA